MSSNSPISEWSGQDSPDLDFDDSPQDNSHITPQNKPKMQQNKKNNNINKNKLVIWELQEWISIDGSQPKFSNHLG